MNLQKILLSALATLPLLLTACGQDEITTSGTSADAVNCSAVGVPHLNSALQQVALYNINPVYHPCIINEAKRLGFEPTWIDSNNYKGTVTYNYVYKKGQQDSGINVNMDLETLKKVTDSHKFVGRGIVQIDTHVKDGKIVYHAVYAKGAVAERVYYAVSQETHQALTDQYATEGYQSKFVTVASVNGKKFYTAGWNKASATGHSMKSSIKVSDFQAIFDQNSKDGHKLVYRTSYFHSGEPYYIAIFEDRPQSFTSKSGITKEQLDSEITAKFNAGYRNIVNIVSVEIGGAQRYAATWSN